MNLIENGSIANLGHSCFLVKLSGITVLTDPFLTKSIFGIKRVIPPPASPEELKPDIVLISHAHYDHLDLPTIRRLGGNPVLIAPEGCKRLLKGRDVVELKDFEETTVKEVKIKKVPAIHNRGRNPIYNNTGVGGFLLDVGGAKFYFAGDTAFSETLYAEVKAFGGAPDYAMLPIGGFMPKPLKRFHQTPEEAVLAFKILKAGYLIPIHWGTWHAIPVYIKRERAIERLRAFAYVSGIEGKLLVVPPSKA